MAIGNTTRVDVQHILLTAVGGRVFNLEAVGARRNMCISKLLTPLATSSIFLAFQSCYRPGLINIFRRKERLSPVSIQGLTKNPFSTHTNTRSCYNVCKRNAVTIGVDRFPCAHLTTLSCDKVCTGYAREMSNQQGRAKTQTKRL